MKTYRRRLNAARKTALELLRPPVRRPLSEYIEKTINLPSGLSAVPGSIRLWKFQAGLADAMLEYERVTVIKGARLGFSTLLAGAIANFVKIDPTSILAVVPTDDDCRSFMVTQIEAVFAASPELRDAIPITRTGPFGNWDTMRYRRFPGGSFRVVSARSPRNLRAHSARVLIVDEADAMSDTEEGAPILLAEKRTATWADRRIIVGSTPTNSTTSYVHNAYKESDQRVYECECPSCGDFHEIRWADIRWPEDRPDEAGWRCPSCGCIHDDSHKAAMVEAGRWRVTAPHVKNHAGFRLSCLIAPHQPASWPKLAAEFLVAKRRPETLRTFVNTVLGESWDDDDTGGPQPHELSALAEDISLENIPAEVLYLTSGVDIQGDRIEVSTLGFTADDEWLALDHRVLFGSPQQAQNLVWSDLADFLAERYPHPLGGTFGRDAVCIDASDGNSTNQVLSFCAGHRHHLRAIPIKGADGSRPALTPTASKRSRSLMICGVDPIKTRLYERLARRNGVRFSNQPLAYFEQLTSERPVVRYARGQPHRVFERYAGRMAEALDCFVYALAARTAVTTPTPRREAELSNRPISTPAPTIIRSAWLDGAR